MKPGGKLISISDPPDPAFASEQGLNGFLKLVMRLPSFSSRRKAKSRQLSYSFLFVRANGEQLGQITSSLLQTAEAAAACFAGCHYLGVDLMVDVGRRRVVVGEVNAFGDLLPRVLWNGMTTYEAELHSWAGQ